MLYHTKPVKKMGYAVRAFSHDQQRLSGVNYPHEVKFQGVSGIFDFLTGGAQTFKDQFSNQIDSAVAKLENEIGVSLTTNQAARDLKGRAQALQNSPKSDVQSRAAAVVAKANGLISEFDSIQSDATQTLQQLSDVKNSISNDPLFQYSDLGQMGSRVIELFSQKKSGIDSLLTGSVALVGRMDQHIKSVKSLQSDVESLEAYAQGTSLQAIVQNAAGGVTSNVLKPIAIVGTIGVLVYFLAPTFFTRMRKS